ncbi:MAG: AAA family ATPase [Burkholderiaceae bacterium]
MPELVLVEGPVGAGKSTHCIELAGTTGGVPIALDQWFTRLFSPDRPAEEVIRWYTEHKSRLVDLIWDHSLALAAAGTLPILELGLVQRQSRQDIYRRADDAGVKLRVIVLEAPREVRRERVARRNSDQGATFSMTVPDAVFEMASDLWEPPDEFEIEERQIETILTA